MSDQWLSIVEYARQFNMSDMTVRRRIKTGKIHAVLREGKYFIPASEAVKKMNHSQQSQVSGSHASINQRGHQQSIVKPSPMGERYPNHTNSQSQQTNPTPTNFVDNTVVNSMIPNPIRQASQMSATSGLESSTLLAFCEAALKKTQEAELRLDSFYKEKVTRLEAELSARDLQIKQLSQQVEDLQLLARILEKKPTSKSY